MSGAPPVREGFDLPAQDKLALLQAYLAQLPSKRAAFDSLWQRLMARPDDESALSELHLQVHRMAGSAGPYGLPVLGSAAQALDRTLAQLTRRSPNGSRPTAEMLAPCAPLLDALLHAVDAAL